MTIDAQLLAILACPKCKGTLTHRSADQALDCRNCCLQYAIRDGIPVLLIEEAKPLG